MSVSVRRAVYAACLACVAACAGSQTVAPRPERPGPAAPSPGSEPAPEEWRTYVPERCRDPEGNPTQGCRPRRIITTSASIEILEPIGFVDNTAELTPGSHKMIAAVAQSLLGNPSIQVLEVRGHSDSLLHPVERAELARKRAEVVAAQLVSQGVDPVRITTYGASDSELHYPADDARNRRVEFVILARDE